MLRFNVAPQCLKIQTLYHCSTNSTVMKKNGGLPLGSMRLVPCWLFHTRLMKKRRTAHEYV